MELLADSKMIFAQLADFPDAQAVKTLIENHDAWSHSDAVQALTSMAMPPRHPALAARITRQRQALAPLVTHLPIHYASAG